LRWTADLDGTYVALGPLGTATRVEEAWDAAFGGELSLTRVREHRRISALGVAVGAMRFAERDGGRLWVEALAASRRPFGIPVGLGLGPTLEVHEVTPPLLGGEVTLWIFAGAIPYARLGIQENTGVFMDFGIKIALPALRW
jgi:hypothetical protein